MLSQLKVPFFTILFIFLFFYIFSKLFGPLPLSINSVTTTKTDLFTVSGKGEATAVPQTAKFSAGVTKTASTVQDAQNQVNTAANKIINELKRLGIDEKKIRTTNFNVSPNYDYTGGRNNIIGYTVSQNLDVEVTPIDKANQAVDIATANGANVVSGVQFTLDDATREKLENEARKKAIESAKKKARSVADAADIRLGRIINVQESDGTQPPMYNETRELKTTNVDTQQTELQPGENTVRITIMLSYETL